MRSERTILTVSSQFLAPLPGTPVYKIGELHTIFYLLFLVLLVYLSVFTFVSLIKNTKLCDFTSHNNSDFICTPITTPATSAPSYEIKPALLNLVMKDQFSGARDDVALHLNNFIELCDMQKYKEVDGDIVKLNLFPFSLRDEAKIWF